MSGRVVHIEVPPVDDDRARASYKTAFGWTITPMPEMSYTMVSTGPTTAPWCAFGRRR
jgi:predicted enzyme related to lactoylglutathione lyase